MTNSLRAILTLLLCACGGTAGGTAAVAGASLNVTTALSVSGSDSKGGAGFIVLTSDSALCDQLAGGHTGAGQQLIQMLVYTVDSNKLSHAATAAGDYQIDPSSPDGLFATLDYFTEDASCGRVATGSGKAIAGTVHVAAIQGNLFTGSFDVTLSSGEHATGNFSPAACPALEHVLAGDALTCE